MKNNIVDKPLLFIMNVLLPITSYLECSFPCYQAPRLMLALTVLVVTVDALRHFETG